MQRPRLLHAHSTFDLGGKEARAVALMNAWRDRAEHVVWSAIPTATAAMSALDSAVPVGLAAQAPPLAGRPSPARLHGLARFMRGFDLILSYNWGAMDAVMAHRLFARSLRLPPLIHHEDGFNADEAHRQKPSRVLFRRLALPTACRLVVPSRTLENIALTSWRQPAARVMRIGNGIDTIRFAIPPASDAIPGLLKRPGDVWIGTAAGLKPVKNLPRLVRAFAGSGSTSSHLVIVGEGPDRDAILQEARRHGVHDRVHLPGFLPDPARWIGLFDVFALSSDSEQFPISLIEAMAAGCAIAATDVGDVRSIVAPESVPHIVPAEDEAALARVLAYLLGNPAERARIGMENAAKAIAELDVATMRETYARLYEEALARPGALQHDLCSK